MRLIIQISATLLTAVSSAALAETADCPDLGHVYNISATKVAVTQEGCDSWSRQMFTPDGDAYGDPSVLTFSDKWSNDVIDDEYEWADLRHRWFWGPGRKSLVHDYAFETLNKASGERTFGSMSEVFSAEKAGIRRQGTKLTRRIGRDGAVSVTAEPSDEIRARQ
jgi:hypothetical protein